MYNDLTRLAGLNVVIPRRFTPQTAQCVVSQGISSADIHCFETILLAMYLDYMYRKTDHQSVYV